MLESTSSLDLDHETHPATTSRIFHGNIKRQCGYMPEMLGDVCSTVVSSLKALDVSWPVQ